jgi:hypothetical protein
MNRNPPKIDTLAAKAETTKKPEPTQEKLPESHDAAAHLFAEMRHDP